MFPTHLPGVVSVDNAKSLDFELELNFLRTLNSLPTNTVTNVAINHACCRCGRNDASHNLTMTYSAIVAIYNVKSSEQFLKLNYGESYAKDNTKKLGVVAEHSMDTFKESVSHFCDRGCLKRAIADAAIVNQLKDHF